MSNRDYLIFFCDQIQSIILESDYEINDMKGLRNSLATFIYKLSSDD